MKTILKILLVIDLLAVNAGVGYIIYKNQIEVSTSPVPPPNLGGGNEGGGIAELRDQMAEVRTELKNLKLVSPAPTVKVAPTAKSAAAVQPTRTKVRNVAYVTVPGSGSSSKNDWETLSGTEFYFDKSDYPGLTEVYFEANMKLFNGNGMAYVRLLDSTNGVAVQGSDVQTNSQVNTVVFSGKVNFWAGKNLIKVQAKNLTADTAVYNWGRLRIVTEN
jgi:hypothetical protein